MRLLNVKSLEFAEFHNNGDKPRYVIASHRWATGCEATFKDIQKKRNTGSIGYQKIESFARYIADEMSSIDWLWIDTCCINKDSAAELSEAINLMFEWYSAAEVCLVYLADVEAVEDRTSFEQSEWFKRGWTLQELLAPRAVVFLTKTWQVIGNKGGPTNSYTGSPIGHGLEDVVARITGIPESVLHNYAASLGMPVNEKMKWMNGRSTSVEEDMFYALYGICGVSPGANYGERRAGAKRRLLTALAEGNKTSTQDMDGFRRITKKLSPPNPWTNHSSARQRHEADTCAWLLECNQYQQWKSGNVQHIWIHGKPGCGKTVLCSTAVEDIQVYCRTEGKADVGLAIFYFSFSDNQKQTYEDLLHSLIAQLAWKEPALTQLCGVFKDHGQNIPSIGILEAVLDAALDAYEKVYLMIDALDECPEIHSIRRDILGRLEELASRTPNLSIFATSRPSHDIHESMESLGALQLAVGVRAVDADIRRYVANELVRDRTLRRINAKIKSEIEDLMAEKADGMFRWAYCQLQDLKNLKDFRPSYIRKALHNLPVTLDETYARILRSIDTMYRQDALALLRWLVYSRSPPTLSQLVDVVVTDPAEDTVDVEDRGELEGPLRILHGLIIILKADEDIPGLENASASDSDFEDEVIPDDLDHRSTGASTQVRLAHFSIKEYLESSRILESNVQHFYLDPKTGHHFLAQSCLTYINYYSNSSDKLSSEQDLDVFPLIHYAAEAWYHHSSLQQSDDVSREVRLLASEEARRDWLLVHVPHQPYKQKFEIGDDLATGLYYASLLGLEAVAASLLDRGADVNEKGGWYGNALSAATHNGHTSIVRLLTSKDVDVNAVVMPGWTALHEASQQGSLEIVKLLLTKGADPDSAHAPTDHPILLAVEAGHKEIVRLLLSSGANISARYIVNDKFLESRHKSPDHGNALHCASSKGDEEMVAMLLDHGADVNVKAGDYGYALQAASQRGHRNIVKLLLNRGANVNARGGDHESALIGAAIMGHEDIVRLLLGHGADIDAQGGGYGRAFELVAKDKFSIFMAFLGRPISGQASGWNWGRDQPGGLTALSAAAITGRKAIVELLLSKGADIFPQAGSQGNALYTATWIGSSDILDMLLQSLANDKSGGEYGNDLDQALYLAVCKGDTKIVRLLIEHGADVETRATRKGAAIERAVEGGRAEIIQLLQDATRAID